MRSAGSTILAALAGLTLAASSARAQPAVTAATPERATLAPGDAVRIALSGRGLDLIESTVVLLNGRAVSTFRGELAATRDPLSRALVLTSDSGAAAGVYTVQAVEARTGRTYRTPIELTVRAPEEEKKGEPPREEEPAEEPPPPAEEPPPAEDPDPAAWEPRQFAAGELQVVIDQPATGAWEPRQFAAGSLQVAIDMPATGEWVQKQFAAGALQVVIDQVESP